MNYIFITGMGRSGTLFLATMLGNLPGVHSGHEMIGDREYWLLSWYLKNTSYAREYLKRERKTIESNVHHNWYVDINSYLQYSSDELKEVFKPETVLHLVRHPKDVIRSLYARRSESVVHLVPKEQTEIDRWLDGDRFQQICWNWKDAVENLLDKNIPVIRFEELRENYDYFNDKLLKPFGFVLDEKNWKKMKSKKINKTKSALYRRVYSSLKGKNYNVDILPDYPGWPEKYKEIFQTYCFPAMKKLGYTI
jgi:hypothetical protein